MIDNYYVYAEKALKKEANSTVKGTNEISKIKKQGRNREGEESFKDYLKEEDNRKAKKNSDMEESIIVDSSLKDIIEENKRMQELVDKHFKDYEIVQNNKKGSCGTIVLNYVTAPIFNKCIDKDLLFLHCFS